MVCLREAVINAIVHNDYSFEVPPKFEIFPDRLEITSAGRLPETMTMKEFYEGVSLPRNKELMRIYKDVELVESLGSGIPRILRAYGEDCFHFTENFIRLVLPVAKHPTPTKTHSGGKDGALDVAIELTDRQALIYMTIKDNVALNVAINTKYLSDKIGVNRKTIQRDLLVLKDKGLIEWSGSKKMGSWRLKK